MIAPVEGSGFTPEWIALVPNFMCKYLLKHLGLRIYNLPTLSIMPISNSVKLPSLKKFPQICSDRGSYHTLNHTVMTRIVLLTMVLFSAIISHAQRLTGYYESEPPMEDLDHFRITHHQDLFEVKAFLNEGLLWSSEAMEMSGEGAEYFVNEYGQGRDIQSVHRLQVLLDGLDWEIFLLAYVDENGKNRYIVVEEIFLDETEQDLLEVNVFEWSHTHHHG
jgi:hypothetical protein